MAQIVKTNERATVLSSALAHPRSLMGDYNEVEKSFKQLLAQLGFSRWYMRKPWALVHLIPHVEGGYTNVELRAFQEAMLGAGCESVFMLDYKEPPLNETQLLHAKKSMRPAIIFSD